MTTFALEYFSCFSQISLVWPKCKQPHSQGPLGVQNGILEKTLANSKSFDHKFANHKPAASLKTIKIFNIFGDLWPGTKAMISIFLCSDFIPFVLKHYGQSLQFGNKFIYQSMPRLLTIWLDFGATVSDQGNGTVTLL